MLITIFTPTFNRASTLSRCYQSILGQKLHSIEWVIVDDGSTDETRECVDAFISEGKLPIRYYYQSNTGKQGAWNKAIRLARGDFFIGLDSDDALENNSLGFFLPYLEAIAKDPLIAGIRCQAKYSASGYVANKFLSDVLSKKESWFEEFGSRCFGERIDIFKTAVLKEFEYPIAENIKFIPEVWLYVTLSSKYKLLYMNKVLRVFFDEHENNRLSRTSLAEHARGHRISRGAMLKNIPIIYFLRNPVAFIKSFIRYIQSGYFIMKHKG